MKTTYITGFTLIEILISIAIISILSAIAIINFGGTRTNKVLQITANDIVFALEESKSNSLAGKGGENHGVYISTDTYTIFNGASYDSGDSENNVKTIDSKLSLSTTAPSNSIIFSRITGNANAASTITVYETADDTNKIEIAVGTLGDITMIE